MWSTSVASCPHSRQVGSSARCRARSRRHRRVLYLFSFVVRSARLGWSLWPVSLRGILGMVSACKAASLGDVILEKVGQLFVRRPGAVSCLVFDLQGVPGAVFLV